MSKTIRVVVDTNSWVSGFISKRSVVAQRLTRLIANERTQLLFSQDLHDEIMSVIQRPKFSKYTTREDLHDYATKIAAYDLQPVTSVVTICRDPKDNFLLALCLDGNADLLIAGDQDLLVLQQFHRTRIISWAEAEAEPGLLVAA